jgi:hypothetical protein
MDGSAAACQLPVEAEEPEPISEAVRFSLDRDTALDSHIFVPVDFARSDTGYGGGGALVDFNDDGLIDVFLGRREASGTPPCLYLNESTGGVTTFRRFQCFPELTRVGGGRTADWDSDGHVELLLYGDDRAVLLDFEDAVSVTEVIRSEDVGDNCLIYSGIQHPTDSDTIVFAFGPTRAEGQETPTACQPVAVERQEDGFGSPTPWSATPFSPVVLALGRGDVNLDGHLDTAFVVDTFSNPDSRNVGVNPGGYLPGNIGEEDGVDALAPWIENSQRSWGSFMGISQMRVPSSVVSVLTDWGPPLFRLSSFNSDIAATVYPEAMREDFPFSWSPVVVDFNLDGRDDVLLTRGTILASDREDGLESDLLLTQGEDGVLTDVTEGSGLVQHPQAYPDSSQRKHYSRAGVATDFDLDGRVDILIMPYEGRPLLYEAEAATHCIAEVSTPYVSKPNALYGWAWVDSQGNAHPRRMDGHMRLGQAEELLLPSGNGVVRTPSGARISYSCEPGDRIELAAPEWATLADDELVINLCELGVSMESIGLSSLGEAQVSSADSESPTELRWSSLEFPVDIMIDGKFALRCATGESAGCGRSAPDDGFR